MRAALILALALSARALPAAGPRLWFDDAGFAANEQCCSCGGGTFPASARLAPLPASANLQSQESSRLVQASSAYS